MQTVPASPASSEQTVRRVVLLALLYLIPSVQAMLPVDDPDIWWHLRTGEWIVENGAVPHEDYFSAYGNQKPWIAYSWLFEVLVYLVHVKLGIAGLVYLVVAMGLASAFAAHQLVRRSNLPMPAEVALVAMALGAMKPLMSPRPWLFTILFFTIELLIIARASQSGKDRLLWLLPPLFAIWANLHIQFVYGLAVIGILLGEALLATHCVWFRFKFETPPLTPGRLALVTLACAAATLLTPYKHLIFKPLFEYVGQTGTFQNISEMHPMFFHSPTDWIVLALALLAAFALGWQRKWLPFPTLLLLMGAFLAFRARRDAWVLVLIAIGLIGDAGRRATYGNPSKLTRRQIAMSALAVVLVLYSTHVARQISEAHLQSEVDRKFPVGAVSYIKTNQLPGPLFNHLDWGGYLIWSLRELPVAIDGRTNLHGDERIERSLNTWQGGAGWESDPDLLRARLVISDKARPLLSLLRNHPGYKVVYEDKTAVVLISVK
jgi:hypothetical protein